MYFSKFQKNKIKMNFHLISLILGIYDPVTNSTLDLILFSLALSPPFKLIENS